MSRFCDNMVRFAAAEVAQVVEHWSSLGWSPDFESLSIKSQVRGVFKWVLSTLPQHRRQKAFHQLTTKGQFAEQLTH